MSISLKIIQSESYDPYMNLSIENEILMNLKADERVIFLYKNKPSIVMGRFQNPWLECNLEALIDNKVQLVRRQSGGGCVYHDLGNLNFSFFYPDRDYQKDQNNSFIIETLKAFGLNAYASGRSDLLIDHNGDKKFSGSAFKQKKDRSFHHGTLLFKSSLDDLNSLLKNSRLSIEKTKSIKSNPAHVINLTQLNSELNEQTFMNQLEYTLSQYYDAQAINSKISAPEDNNYLAEIKNWSWLWGETPEFSFTFKNLKCVMRKAILIEVKNNLGESILENFKLSLENLVNRSNNSTDDELEELLNYFEYQIKKLTP